jgi:hypothetical protein
MRWPCLVLPLFATLRREEPVSSDDAGAFAVGQLTSKENDIHPLSVLGLAPYVLQAHALCCYLQKPFPARASSTVFACLSHKSEPVKMMVAAFDIAGNAFAGSIYRDEISC